MKVQKKTLEQELKENEVFYRHLAELTPEAIVIHSKGTIVYANPSAAKFIHAKNPEDLIGKQIMNYVHPDSKELVVKRVKMMMKSKRIADTVEEKFIDGKGNTIIAEVKAIPFVFRGQPSILVILRDITEWKETEELRERAMTILETMSDAFITINKKFEYTYVNAPAEKILNKTRDELIGKKVFDVIPQAKNTSFHKYALQVFKTKKPESYEEYSKILDKWVEAKFFLSKEGLAFYFRDITLRKKAEESFKKSSQRINDVLENLNDGFVEMDKRFRYQYVNKRALELSHKKSEDLIGKKWHEVNPQVKSTPFWKAAHETLQLRKPTWVEAYYPPFHKWYETSYYPTDKGLVAFSRDITERKIFEANLTFLTDASKVLASSLDYNKTLQNVATLAVQHIADWCLIEIIDDKGQLQSVAVRHKDPKKTQWVEKLRKINPPNLSGDSGIAWVLKNKKSILAPVVTDEMLVTRAKSKEELENLRKMNITSGMIIPLITKNKVIGIISFLSSESEKLYSKSDLTMAEEVASRAALAIENARLFSNEQKAVTLRDEFLALASHELKTPITSLGMFLTVLERYSQEENDKRSLPVLLKMRKQIVRMTKLINDLLDISKIQEGQLKFRKEKLAIDNLIKEIVETLQGTSLKHKIFLDGQTKKKVLADKDRIGQVLINLITNAIKYSPQADRIIIYLKAQKDKVIVTVQDFGIGITEENQKKVFNRFFRVEGTNENTYPGFGIGLYITQDIIKQHNGEIWVESEKNKGSKFSFSLPIVE